MNTLDFIASQYQLDLNQPSPISVFRSREWSLPRLIKALGFTVGAEVGVDEGIYSETLLKINPQFRLYLIDSWSRDDGYSELQGIDLEQRYNAAKARLKLYRKAMFVREFSMNAVKRFADESLDFVYIDAAHDYEHVSEDIREWSKKVKKGGIIAGYGYKDVPGFGVIKAVDEWVKQNDIKPLFILRKAIYPTWMYIK